MTATTAENKRDEYRKCTLNTVSFFNLLHDMLARRTNNRKLKFFSAVCKNALVEGLMDCAGWN